MLISWYFVAQREIRASLQGLAPEQSVMATLCWLVMRPNGKRYLALSIGRERTKVLPLRPTRRDRLAVNCVG
jgi:hypothetical protein